MSRLVSSSPSAFDDRTHRSLVERDMPMSQIVLGTHNEKKGIELDDLLRPHGLTVLTLRDFKDALHVIEDGDSFAANARKKAAEQARHLGQWVLGEDSGLVVDALDGAPGIYSARFSGPAANDASNNEYLLAQMENVPPAKRTAHYYCHVALADCEGTVRAESHGKCCGRILSKAVGTGGFGYDPLFEIREYHRTFGELGSAVKTVLSHRSRAVRAMIPQLLAFRAPP